MNNNLNTGSVLPRLVPTKAKDFRHFNGQLYVIGKLPKSEVKHALRFIDRLAFDQKSSFANLGLSIPCPQFAFALIDLRDPEGEGDIGIKFIQRNEVQGLQERHSLSVPEALLSIADHNADEDDNWTNYGTGGAHERRN